MLFSVGYLLLAFIRWYGKSRRRTMFRRLLSKVSGTSSLSIQKRALQSGGTSRRFIKIDGQFQETPLTVCKQMLITAISPKQTVDLSDWTAYIKPQGCDTRRNVDTDVTVILEAVRPDNLQDFLNHELEVSPAEKIHVMDHGCATSWIPGTPFGIIYHCSFEELITLTMGMEDGFLTLNEDLEVTSLKTVETVGTPACLIQTEENVPQQAFEQIPRISITADRQVTQEKDNQSEHLAEDIAHTISGEHDTALETWSNESLASNSSVGKVELLDPSESDIMDDNKDQADFMEESGSGEGLSEMTGEDLDGDERTSRQATAKPPNVLIYTGKTDTVRKFEKVKKVLEQCLDPDCYVIYHLKHEELDTSPWIDNTSLLVISSAKVTEDQTGLFLQYFYAGGKILSLGTGLDSVFVNKTQIRNENWMSRVQFESWNDVALVCSRFVFDLSKTLSSKFSVKEIAKDKDNNTVLVKVKDKTHSSDGCAVLSQMTYAGAFRLEGSKIYLSFAGPGEVQQLLLSIFENFDCVEIDIKQTKQLVSKGEILLVLLESDAADLGVTPEIFNQLKQSNAMRFEILSRILDALGLECSRKSPKPLTAAGLVTKSKEIQDLFLMSIEKRLSRGSLKTGSISLLFLDSEGQPAEENLLPVIKENTDTVCTNFNSDTYMNNLQTKVLGNTVIYVDVVPTTMPLLDGMMFSVPDEVGLIVIARQQTSGKGRGGNSWLSPVGCAMFTLHVTIPLESNLGKCVSYLQHITSLAVVYSVCEMEGYQDIDLRLKWPNDLYYGQVMKLGGVIVKSTILDGMVHAIIGCGFNVDNSNPTICINDIIQSYNRQSGTQLPACTTEQLVARTVTWIEKLIDKFQKDGHSSFQKMYYEKWLHSDATVTLHSEGNMKVKILGLDEYGYLLVQKTDGQTISVQPDGNSFDMMKNLITLKTR